MISPVINTESIRIQEGGELPKGLYFYALTKLDMRGNESYPHVVQVYARYGGNIVSLSWKPDPMINEYRLYRGTSLSNLTGYFTIFDAGIDEDDFLDFNDDGTGILNEFNTLQL